MPDIQSISSTDKTAVGVQGERIIKNCPGRDPSLSPVLMGESSVAPSPTPKAGSTKQIDAQQKPSNKPTGGGTAAGV